MCRAPSLVWWLVAMVRRRPPSHLPLLPPVCAVGPRNKTDFVIRRVRTVPIPGPPYYGTLASVMGPVLGAPPPMPPPGPMPGGGMGAGGGGGGGLGLGGGGVKRRREDEGDGGMDVYRARMHTQMAGSGGF